MNLWQAYFGELIKHECKECESTTDIYEAGGENYCRECLLKIEYEEEVVTDEEAV